MLDAGLNSAALAAAASHSLHRHLCCAQPVVPLGCTTAVGNAGSEPCR